MTTLTRVYFWLSFMVVVATAMFGYIGLHLPHENEHFALAIALMLCSIWMTMRKNDGS